MSDRMRLILGIVFFGSVWGGMEALAIRVMESLNSPFKSPFLIAMGIFVLGTARIIFPRQGSTFFMGLVAAGFKFLSLPNILFCQIAAVAIQGLVLEGVFSYVQKRKLSNWLPLSWLVVLAVYLNNVFFVLSQIYVVPNPFWMGKGSSGILTFIFLEGSAAAVLGIIFLNLGFALGKAISPAFERWQVDKARTLRIAFLAASLGFWLLGFVFYR